MGPIKRRIQWLVRLLAPTPGWLILLAIVGFYYAFFNFMVFAMNNPTLPGIRDGQYILHSHGKLIQADHGAGYHLAQANEGGGFSGHWIAVYGIAMVIW
ncbi:MAG: hypothetical protein U0176_14815 [Bacteroidia bacterium]